MIDRSGTDCPMDRTIIVSTPPGTIAAVDCVHREERAKQESGTEQQEHVPSRLSAAR